MNTRQKIYRKSLQDGLYALSLGLFTILLASCMAATGPTNPREDDTPTAGSLDASFGNGGIVVTDYIENSYSTYNEIAAVAIQSDGKILAAGSVELDATNYDFIVARYNSNGSLDTSFGTNGFVTIDFDGKNDYAMTMAIQSDGKIVVGGYSKNNDESLNRFALIRLTTDGNFDNDFDTDGKVIIELESGKSANLYKLLLTPDGKIVTVGSCDNDFAVAVFTSSGTLDTSFDGDGKIVTNIENTSNDYASAVAIQNDGKIVVAGYADISGKGCFALVRYNTNGSLDTSFDTDGILTTNFDPNSAQATSIVLTSDGKIIAGGYSGSASMYFYTLARYTQNGTLDTSFGTNGKIETFIQSDPNNCIATAMKLQPDGKILLGGYSLVTAKLHFTILRYNASGTLDSSFGTNGKATVAIPDLANAMANSYLYDLAVQQDGKIVAGGFIYDTNSGTDCFALIRLWP